MSGFNQLEDVYMIGGGYSKFNFEVLDESGNLIQLQDTIITWTITRYGEKENVLVKKDNSNIGGITITGLGTFMVELSSDDTFNLPSGKYEHEYFIKQGSNKIYRPIFGFINIKQNVNLK